MAYLTFETLFYLLSLSFLFTLLITAEIIKHMVLNLIKLTHYKITSFIALLKRRQGRRIVRYSWSEAMSFGRTPGNILS